MATLPKPSLPRDDSTENLENHANSNVKNQKNQEILDGQHVLAFLEKLSQTLDEIDFKTNLIDKKIALKACNFFSSDDSCQALFLIQLDGQYQISTIPIYQPGCSTIALLKSSPVLSADLSVAKQVQIVNFGVQQEASQTYQTMFNILHHSMTPLFDAFTSSNSKEIPQGSLVVGGMDDKDPKSGIPLAKKRFAELELQLLHLQQNISVPTVTLAIHPVILAAMQGKEKVTLQDVPESSLQDSSFLNQLSSDVNVWINEIRKITKLDRDPRIGTAAQEVQFWLQLEHALNDIKDSLQSDQVRLTLDILKNAKRFHATVSFENDTGLRDARERVEKVMLLMRDFPLNDLPSATDVVMLKDAVVKVFDHINKKLKLANPYPVARALSLVECIAKDFSETLLRLLSNVFKDQTASGKSGLFFLSWSQFSTLTSECNQLFDEWDNQVREFVRNARDQTRRRRENYVQVKVDSPQAKQLQRRLEYLEQFRQKHEQLRSTVASVLEGDQTNALNDIDRAFLVMRSANLLDLTEQGTMALEDAETVYNNSISRVEHLLIQLLQETLNMATSTSEMYRVFHKFNALLVRPNIRGAVGEWQSRLLENIWKDVGRLHDKLKQGSDASCQQLVVRDASNLSSQLTWAKQIRRQLDSYMSRVEAILGPSWQAHAEGARLMEERNALASKLDTKPLVDSWVKQMLSRDLTLNSPVFTVGKVRVEKDGVPVQLLQLQVCMDPELVNMYKDVRNLLWHGYSIPRTLVTVSQNLRRVHPFVSSLSSSIHTYQTTCDVQLDSTNQLLLQASKCQVQRLIPQGLALHWKVFAGYYDSHTLSAQGIDGLVSSASKLGMDKQVVRSMAFVKDLANAVEGLKTKTRAVLQMQADLDTHLYAVDSCEWTREAIQQPLQSIQAMIDRLSLESYTNVEAWCQAVDEKVCQILSKRLIKAVQAWFASFRHEPLEPLYKFVIEPCHHQIVMEDVIRVEPSLEQGRRNLQRQLNNVLHVLTLPRLAVGKLGITDGPIQKQDYGDLMTVFSSHPSLSSAHQAIENNIQQAQAYADQWIEYQALWELNGDLVESKLGQDLSQWQTLVKQVRGSRNNFDSSDGVKQIDHVHISYGKIQSKVAGKYDAWQRDLLHRLADKTNQQLQQLFQHLSQARHELEGTTLSTGNIVDTLHGVVKVARLQDQRDGWKPLLEQLILSQNLLERLKFAFPQDWVHVEGVKGEWDAFCQILARKYRTIQEQKSLLQQRLVHDTRTLDSRIQQMVQYWEEQKPVKGDLSATIALKQLSQHETKFRQIADETKQFVDATEALDWDDMPFNPVSPTRIQNLLEEVGDFKQVWTELGHVWSDLEMLASKRFSQVTALEIRQGLDKLLTQCREMPSRTRQYAAFDHLQEHIRSLSKMNSLLTDLKSESLCQRHWSQILSLFKIKGSLEDMTLEQLWKMDLKRYEKQLRDILSIAQGEMGLEEFIRQLKEHWSHSQFDLYNYQNKIRLVRGWDDMFAKLSDHMNGLHSMKHSPYYKVFEEEGQAWEDKLGRLHQLLDTWVEVQRQWIYLEGIFASPTSDIKTLLPVESSRFASINADFSGMLKKIYKSPVIIDVLQIPELQSTMDRLSDMLDKIQKSLGEYLERERQRFPRFYFVGDEDLLEMLGNSRDTNMIEKHLPKMFAGISHLQVEEDKIVSFSSREGEVLHLDKPIHLTTPEGNVALNEWLHSLELDMKSTLDKNIRGAVQELQKIYSTMSKDLFSWLNKWPGQATVVAMQIVWTLATESRLPKLDASKVDQALAVLAQAVLQDLNDLDRRKCQNLVTVLVHQKQVLSLVIKDKDSFNWQRQLRYYLEPGKIVIRQVDANIEYGFEYLGVSERLVQTPLTDRCYLTLTQALHRQLGGSPFGPAGTGKTESVKALGGDLGRQVLVFCCDENFDFKAMSRIFLGLCRVGAWGCFDEFNRLEERILSAVSQRIQTIQMGLLSGGEIDMLGKKTSVHRDTALFITMNPGYAGRQNLPENLKKLFRSIAMAAPDRQIIAQVLLFSQGFREADVLSGKVVQFFDKCSKQLSKQSHYDFGLRALKSMLVSAGNIMRESSGSTEEAIVISSIQDTVAPKLVGKDVEILGSLLLETFSSVSKPSYPQDLLDAVEKSCEQYHYIPTERFLAKILQLYRIQSIHHGIMLVGEANTGKSAAWQTLLLALGRLDGQECQRYVIDAKSVGKNKLYGHLDPMTREWTDGLFTNILRKIIENVRGEAHKRHWIVFDGDVDPEWVENLNSVLDDNRMLTLPNGERLALPSNVRIVFEVENLKYATLATVSRCGMVWFGLGEPLETDMLFARYLAHLKRVPLEQDDWKPTDNLSQDGTLIDEDVMSVQRSSADILAPHLSSQGWVGKALQWAQDNIHVMDFTIGRALQTLFSLLNKTVRDILDYNASHSEFPMSLEVQTNLLTRRLLLAIVWSFAGDANSDLRNALTEVLRGMTSLPSGSLVDYNVRLENAKWITWHSMVPRVDVEPHQVAAANFVVPTADTLRHEAILYSLLAEHKPLLLCGPPGSGKTMTLFAALRKLPDLDVVGINFSSTTVPELVLSTLEVNCEYRKTPEGITLAPRNVHKWLVLFCDEINLPSQDTYGTQRIILFLRQLIEQGGFWKSKGDEHFWVNVERIQVVGACNPPTDVGRVALSHRFLRHAPLILVDYPGPESLLQIYGTFARATLKLVPNLSSFADSLVSAMVDVYLESQERFTGVESHYIYSPRELTRWIRGLFEVLQPLEGDSLSPETLVRIWAHEALRLFQDRLVREDERVWFSQLVDRVAQVRFKQVNLQQALQRPILFSNWMSRNYVSVEREELREHLEARLRSFQDEELDRPMVMFDNVLEHVLRIDRVLRQMQGHMLLIGLSHTGKTTMARFAAWMNGMTIFQIKSHNKYTAADFDDDLRSVLRKTGCGGERIVLLMDETNVRDAAFLERMNTLLANAEVPGLFTGDELTSLNTAIKEAMLRDPKGQDTSPEGMQKWFTLQVMKNLHVIFTMNPPSNLSSQATASPALFNRCVLDWVGDWDTQAFYQVASELTDSLDLEVPRYQPPKDFPLVYPALPLPPTHRQAMANAMVNTHRVGQEVAKRLRKRQSRLLPVTPGSYLDLIKHFSRIFSEKRQALEEHQRHLSLGVDKLKSTVMEVEGLQRELHVKSKELEHKNLLANEKLKQMVADQNEAEQNRMMSLTLQKELAKQEQDIAKRSTIVKQELDQVEPLVAEAKTSVSAIKKQHLVELRSMSSPPQAVKLALEAVCTLLGYSIASENSWKMVQGVVKRDDFIASIVNFDTDKGVSEQTRQIIKQSYLSDPMFNFESVNRASKACGPLAQWVIAQVSYGDILEKVGPLRLEVAQLEESSKVNRDKAKSIQENLVVLERSIQAYKKEYGSLIAQVQQIQLELDRVKSKVDRSTSLITNLASEQQRWSSSIGDFGHQLETTMGDALLAAAMLAYGGYFDQTYRQMLMDKWKDHLNKAKIGFKQDLAVAEWLALAEDRLIWHSKGLPQDELCLQNAVMLKRHQRWPLIIDPSGQGLNFILSEWSSRKIVNCSFLDDNFAKTLESALRFGTMLVVHDVDHLDTLINPVLNRDWRSQSGRALVRLGSKDIDVSPSFCMMLVTRDAMAQFTPDVASRVTMVNFTVTSASLQSQCLHALLKKDRPDVEAKQQDLIKLQGEFVVRLRQLEQSLLEALAQAKGNLLEDDAVLEKLETLKKEANDVEEKMGQTHVMVEQVEKVTKLYRPVAKASAKIFATLEHLAQIHHFYRFSLDFFLEIFERVLNMQGDGAKRVEELTQNLFREVMQQAAPSLLYQDRSVLAMSLVQAFVECMTEEDVDLTRLNSLEKLATLPMFKTLNVIVKTKEWSSFIDSVELDWTRVPICWKSDGKLYDLTCKLLLVLAYKSEWTQTALNQYVDIVFGQGFSHVDLDMLRLKGMVVNCQPNTPILFASPAGYDASWNVEHFAQYQGNKTLAVALGSNEALMEADKLIMTGQRDGTWILIKNIHLAEEGWLNKLEKRLEDCRDVNSKFRLFLTTEMHPSVPATLLQMSRTLVFEAPPGIKASVYGSLTSLDSQRVVKPPMERVRLYFLISWLHGILQERLRFSPIGWKKKIEFTEADQEAAFCMVDYWLQHVSQGRSNISPDKISWETIRGMLKETVYGGKIDNDEDQAVLNHFVDVLFQPKSFDLNFELASNLTILEGVKMEQFVKWVQKLPEEQPTWIGLDQGAEVTMAKVAGKSIIVKLIRMQELLNDEELAFVDE